MTSTICFNHYFLEYLLVSDNIERDLNGNKNIITNIDFLKFLNYLVDYDNENNYLSKNMRDNIKKLFMFLDIYLDKNKDYYEEIKNKYHDYPESGMFYLNQFLIKYDDIEDYKNNSCTIWNIRDINDSVRYDLGMLISLFLKPKVFVEEYLPYLVNNQEFIYFAKRFLMQYPEVAKQQKKRIINILEFNKKCNYNLKGNNELLEKYKHINQKNDYNTFRISDFIEEYNQIKIEDNILNNKNEISSPLMFEHVKQYVLNLDNIDFSKDMKKSIINILANIKESLDKKYLKEYNDLLLLINSKENGNLSKNMVISVNHTMQKYGVWDYLKIILKKEVADISLSIETDKKVMDYIIGKISKENIENYDECYATINRFAHESVSIFKSPLVHEKLNELLTYLLNMEEVKENKELYFKTKCAKRKVNRLY